MFRAAHSTTGSMYNNTKTIFTWTGVWTLHVSSAQKHQDFPVDTAGMSIFLLQGCHWFQQHLWALASPWRSSASSLPFSLDLIQVDAGGQKETHIIHKCIKQGRLKQAAQNKAQSRHETQRPVRHLWHKYKNNWEQSLQKHRDGPQEDTCLKTWK